VDVYIEMSKRSNMTKLDIQEALLITFMTFKGDDRSCMEIVLEEEAY